MTAQKRLGTEVQPMSGIAPFRFLAPLLGMLTLFWAGLQPSGREPVGLAKCGYIRWCSPLLACSDSWATEDAS